MTGYLAAFFLGQMLWNALAAFKIARLEEKIAGLEYEKWGVKEP